MITIVRRRVGASPETRASYLRGSSWRNLIADVAKDMGDQARANIIKFGGPGGGWQKLSGYNAATGSKNKVVPGLNKAKKWSDDQIVTSAYERSTHAAKRKVGRLRKKLSSLSKQKSWAHQRGAQKIRDSLIYLVHLGYARRKAAGKTPGHGEHGADVELRDTDSMFDGMDGNAKFVGDGATITMVSRGKAQGRSISNNDLFHAHATGAGNLPVRNPAQDMTLFERVTAQRYRKFIADIPKV